MNVNPKVSILLPTYNGETYVCDAIKSVVQQSWKDWELIICDDASFDDTYARAMSCSSGDVRILFHKNKKNVGLAANLNVCITMARGEYIARIDEDDTWTNSDKLEKQIDYLDRNPDCSLIGTAFRIVDEGGSHIRDVMPPDIDDVSIRSVMLLYNPFGHSTVMFRKKDVLNLGGYDTTIRYGEDYDLWLRLGRLGKFAILPDISMQYLMRSNAMSGVHNRGKQVRLHARLLRRYGRYYPRFFVAIMRLCIYMLTKK